MKIGKHRLKTIVGCAKMHCMHMHLEHAAVFISRLLVVT